MIKRISIVLTVILVLFAGVWALRSQQGAKKTVSAVKLNVVVTNSILENMVEEIAGDKVNLYSIVPRGIDPHEYEPKPQDITKTSDADVLFHNGLNLETGGSGWFNKMIKNAHKTEEKEVFSASKNVAPMYLTTKGETNTQDPHAWLNVENGMRYVKRIAEVLKEKDPENKEIYQKNTAAYLKKLQSLHDEAVHKFTSIPENRRLLVTSEGAFKYFSKAYHITPAYIWEINTESQGTPEQMKQVLQKIRQTKVKSLFVETSVSPKSMEKVSDETGLPIYSKIFTDSLAKKGSEGDTYYTMIKWDLDKIYEGLK